MYLYVGRYSNSYRAENNKKHSWDLMFHYSKESIESCWRRALSVFRKQALTDTPAVYKFTGFYVLISPDADVILPLWNGIYAVFTNIMAF